jgi:hypothetical protein
MKRRLFWVLLLITAVAVIAISIKLLYRPRAETPRAAEEIIRTMVATRRELPDPMWRGQPAAHWSERISNGELWIGGWWEDLTYREGDERIIVDRQDAARESVALVFMLLLKDKDPVVRVTAARGVGCYGMSEFAEESILCLLEALLDEDEDVRIEAAGELERKRFGDGSNLVWEHYNLPTQVQQLAEAILNKTKDYGPIALADSSLTDADMEKMRRWKYLRELNTPHSKITDAGLAHLAGCKSLIVLDISGTGVTDAGLVHLSSVRNLLELNLTDTNVTDEGVDKLQKALPNLKVIR